MLPVWVSWPPGRARKSALRAVHLRLVTYKTARQHRRVIQDVDEALKTLIRREALSGSDVDLALDAPTKDWAARRSRPTLNLYLYDIREDMQRRLSAWERVRDANGLSSEHAPVRRFSLAYIVTAWTQRPEDEHRLLSALLGCFIRNEVLPSDVLVGSLLQASMPIYAAIALPPPADRNLSDVWSALGGELKPSLDLIITAPMVDGRLEEGGPPVVEETRLLLSSADGPFELAAGQSRSPRATVKRLAEAGIRETITGGTRRLPGRTIHIHNKREG